MSTLVVIPSRNRAAFIGTAVKGVLETSRAMVHVRIDSDQREEYDLPVLSQDRVRVTVGEKIGPVASINEVVAQNPDFDAYGMISDDCLMETPGWDLYVEEKIRDGAIAVSPMNTCGAYVDNPFVAREWVQKLGWMAYPGNYHTGWPTITGVLAEAIGRLVQASRDEFFIHHDAQAPYNHDWLREDARQLYAFFQLRFSKALKVLR